MYVTETPRREGNWRKTSWMNGESEKTHRKRKRNVVSEGDLAPMKVTYYDDEGNVVEV